MPEEKDGGVMISYQSKGKTYYKCPCCNSWGGRIATVKKSLTEDDLDTFGNLSAEDKKKIMLENRGLCGDELKKAVQAMCHHTMTKKSSNEFRASAKLLVLHDLTEKIKHEPDQLASIIAHGHEMACPIRKVELYADP